MSRGTANLLLLLAGLVWGAGFVAQQMAMEDIGPMLFMALRFYLAVIVVLPVLLIERKRDRAKGGAFSAAAFKQSLVVGLFFFGTMSLQQVGILTTTVTSAGFLTGLYVVFTPLIVLLVLRQHQHWIIWPCALTALYGIYLLGDGGFSGLNSGDWLVIAAALVGAAHIVVLGHVVQRHGHPVQIAVTQFAVAGTVSLLGHFLFVAFPAASTIEPAMALQPILNALPEILYAGIFSTGLAFTLMAIGQRYTREADAAILLSSEALFAALFGAWLLGERLGPTGYLGCALIFAAIVLVQLVPEWGKRKSVRLG